MNDLQKLLKNTKTLSILNEKTSKISLISQNSSEITPNSLFFAIKGSHFDGHTYINQAIERGAEYIVCENLPSEVKNSVCYIQVEDSLQAMGQMASCFYDNPSEKLQLVGVTGTNGKTTTASLLYTLFNNLGEGAGLISTISINVNQEVFPTKNTTPDAITINRYLAMMVSQGVRYCFMEVSSHGVSQHRIAGLRFAGGVFTNLTHDHLDFHQTFGAYRDAKKAFFDSLNAQSFAITNADDKNGSFMLQNTKAKRFSYALKSPADFKLKILEHNFLGMNVLIDNQELFTPLIGEFNAYNLLVIYATAICLGLEKTETLVQMSLLKPISGRFQHLMGAQQITGIVDYAHTPDALLNVLNTINEIRLPHQRLLCVVGCGGDRDKTKRPIMGKIATENASMAIFTSDNPRTEPAEEILSQMEQGVSATHQNNYIVVQDRYQAIKTAVKMAQPNDIILVAGKGHETYQEINGKRTHFDDLEVLKEHLEIKK